MKIYIMTDLEGCAGILNREDWVLPGGRYYEKAKQFLTEEVNAAIRGFFDEGATEIVVADGHGPGGIDPELLDERVWLKRGPTSPIWPWLIDNSVDGLAWVGQHAKAGTPYSHITHTQNHRHIDLSINGLSIGEYGQAALCAMELEVPCILACGEKALAEEAEALTPGVVTVWVKRGLLPDNLDHLSMEDYSRAKLGALHMHPVRARTKIYDGARTALRKLKSTPDAFSFPTLEPPYVRVARLRASQDEPAYETRDEHPCSIIELMNMPYTKV